MLLKNYFECVDDLISFHIMRRKMMSLDTKQCLHPIEFAKSYCTIDLNLGRQVGASTYIKQTAKQGELVIVPSVKQTNRIARSQFIGNPDIMSAHEMLVLPKDELKSYTRIYVDGQVTKTMDIMYEKLVREDVEQLFIILGVWE